MLTLCTTPDSRLRLRLTIFLSQFYVCAFLGDSYSFSFFFLFICVFAKTRKRIVNYLKGINFLRQQIFAKQLPQEKVNESHACKNCVSHRVKVHISHP